MKYDLWPLLFLLLLSACSSLKDTREQPAKLAAIDQEVRLQLRSKFQIGQGSGPYLLNITPAIDASTIYAGDYRGRVYAFDKASGKRRWHSQLDVELSTALSLSEDRLYIGTTSGRLLAMDKRDGTVLWQTQVLGEILSRPVSELGIVVVQTVDGAIYGISSASGTTIWTYRIPVPALSLRGTGQPVLHRGLVLTGLDVGRLLALSLLEGRQLWVQPLAQAQGRTELERIVDADMQPVVDRGLVYASAYQGRLIAATIDTGRILWARDIALANGLADSVDAVYLVDQHAEIWAVEKRTGETLWHQKVLRARQLTRPVYYKDRLILADTEGYVHIINAKDGRIVGRERVSQHGYIGPVVVDGERLYLLDRAGSLRVFEVKTI